MDTALFAFMVDRLLSEAEDPQKVYDYLAKNYAKRALGWVKGAKWERRVVSLSQVNFDRRPEGRNFDKVEAITQAIKSGQKMSPVVLVDTGDDKLKVADGYHRTLATKRAGRKTIDAWVATDTDGYDHKAQHAAKLNVAPGEKAQIEPVDHGKPKVGTYVHGVSWPTATLKINGLNGERTLDVHHANDLRLRTLGFTGLPDEGMDQSHMLFEWPNDQTKATFTNRAVPIPIHVSTYDNEGRHVESWVMDQHDPNPRQARMPHRYALEMHPDEADKLGIGPGASLSLADEKNESTNDPLQMGTRPDHNVNTSDVPQFLGRPW